MSRCIRTGVAVAAFSLVGLISPAAHAATFNYVLPDVGTFTTYSVANTGQSFAGNGFVGMYSSNSFAHLLGAETTSSRALVQQDISALSGQTIQSAIVSFALLDGDATPQILTITSVPADGGMEYQFTPTTSYGAVTATTAVGPGTISVDVTALLQARVTAGASYFGLLFSGSTRDQWTWTTPYSLSDRTTDSARLRLTVTTVPEPSALAAVALAGGVLRRRRRR